MVIVMDMTTGMRLPNLADEFGPFEDEVLNAGWLPQPALELGLQEAAPLDAKREPLDVEAFLRAIYLSQE